MTPIITSRLVLAPVTAQLARDVVARRLSGIRAGSGWPHADTADALAMALLPHAGPSWVITVDDLVIGECGAYSWPDEAGVVEIGYGLAQPFRGKGYASEAAEGMCRWLFDVAGARVITATRVVADNVASRRLLGKLGFAEVHHDDRGVSLRLEG